MYNTVTAHMCFQYNNVCSWAWIQDIVMSYCILQGVTINFCHRVLCYFVCVIQTYSWHGKCRLFNYEIIIGTCVVMTRIK